MGRGRITGVLGRILVGGGVLILLFVAYQLWGTEIAESHSQSELRQQFDSLLHRAAPSTTTSTSPPSSTSTTGSGASSTTATTEGAPTVGPTVAAPNDGKAVGILVIKKINLDKVIVQGTSTDDLRQGPGHYVGTPLPGEAGNAAIAGHRTTYGAPFYDLDKLVAGDLINVTTVQGSFVYSVTTSQVVSPSDESVISVTTSPQLTLTTCNPRFSNTTRLVVHAKLINKPAPTLPQPTGSATGPRQAQQQASGLAGSEGSWVPTLWLGIVAAVVMAAMFLVARGRRRGGRLLVYAVGGAASLVALFFFFGAVSPLLPASF